MKKKILYNVYAIKNDKKELVATYSDASDAHAAAQRYNKFYTLIQIEKISQPKDWREI